MPEPGAIAVLGAGSWGTALAALLARRGQRVRLWGRDARAVERMALSRRNERYLPGVELPSGLRQAATIVTKSGINNAFFRSQMILNLLCLHIHRQNVAICASD